MKTRKLLLLAIVFLTGCSTPYQPEGFRGGYTDLNIQDDIFQVYYRGNGYTKTQKIRNFALLRCSEVAIENGYSYFVVLEGEAMIDRSSYTTPIQSNTTGQVYGYGYSSQTIYSGGQTINISKPSVSMTIRCFKTKPDDFEGIIYDAEAVRANMRRNYGMMVKE